MEPKAHPDDGDRRDVAREDPVDLLHRRHVDAIGVAPRRQVLPVVLLVHEGEDVPEAGQGSHGVVGFKSTTSERTFVQRPQRARAPRVSKTLLNVSKWL